MKSRSYYTERAAYMRAQAAQALTEELQKSCLRAAEAYEILADNAGAAEPDDGERE